LIEPSRDQDNPINHAAQAVSCQRARGSTSKLHKKNRCAPIDVTKVKEKKVVKPQSGVLAARVSEGELKQVTDILSQSRKGLRFKVKIIKYNTYRSFSLIRDGGFCFDRYIGMN
jgi:hypothetical protein